MARNEFELVAGVWTDLGDGPLIVTVKSQGSGLLMINTVQDDDTAHTVDPKGSPNRQFAENVTGKTVFAKGVGAGWIVISDTE